ncbi:hypothetical protein [Pseudomonas capsici]|uniref:hypothetical protein n=1 Tax=Pseudomonas capsici TaxID=2810614 RepID=UPI0021F17B82|nr:hypothetical protein [Pseudomonas capsici]MCV4343346.1 hypothetical protein [Pseudomonas capsici]
MRVVVFVSLVAVMLVGCSGMPSLPYEEPAQSENSARIRVITNSNVYGDSIVGSCTPATRHRMAQAGRFLSSGAMNTNYPQYPLKSANLGMPKRVAPGLVQYIPSIRMGQGVYKEVVAEYHVRTDVPLQLATWGASIGGYGSSSFACVSQALAFKLEPGKDYEALIGVGSRSDEGGNEALMCVFGVVELVSMPGTPIVIPEKVLPFVTSQASCKN